MGNGNSRSSVDVSTQPTNSSATSETEKNPTTGIESYNLFNLPRLHKDATFVTTLPLQPGGADSRWPLRNFVEIWKLCANRPDESYDGRTAKIHETENTQQQQQETTTTRRDGQIMFKKFPFAVVLCISRFLEHLPIIQLPEDLKFSCAGTFLMNAPSLIGANKLLTIVEDMKFDMNCVVSFCVRLACDGKVITDSKFFINPSDMTIGIWIPKYHMPKDENTKKPQNKKRGIMWQEQKAKLVKFRLFPRDADEENMLEEALFFDRAKLCERPQGSSSCLLPTDGSVILMDPNFSQIKGFLKDQYYMNGTRE